MAAVGYGSGGGGGDRGNRDGATGPVPLEEGGGVVTGGLPVGTAGGRVHVIVGGSDTQGRRGLPRNKPGGGVEGAHSGH